MTSHVTVASGMSNSSRIEGRAMPTAVVLMPAMAWETPTAARNGLPPVVDGLTTALGHAAYAARNPL